MSTAVYSCSADCLLYKIKDGSLRNKEDVVKALYEEFVLSTGLFPENSSIDRSENDEEFYEALKDLVNVLHNVYYSEEEQSASVVTIEYESELNSGNLDLYNATVKALSRIAGISLIQDNFFCHDSKEGNSFSINYWCLGEQIDVKKCWQDSVCLDFIVSVLEVAEGKENVLEILQEVVELTGRTINKKPEQPIEQ
jgi:hypothetical protein